MVCSLSRVGDFDNHSHTMASRDLRDFAEPSERNLVLIIETG
jgi:hypothetical protein